VIDAADTNGDGTVSASELSNYLTANGGTKSEADTLFSSLSSDGTSSITASDINKAVEKMMSSFASNSYTSVDNLLTNSSATSTTSSGSTMSVSA